MTEKYSNPDQNHAGIAFSIESMDSNKTETTFPIMITNKKF
jgi:hypothetical protein